MTKLAEGEVFPEHQGSRRRKSLLDRAWQIRTALGGMCRLGAWKDLGWPLRRRDAALRDECAPMPATDYET